MQDRRVKLSTISRGGSVEQSSCPARQTLDPRRGRSDRAGAPDGEFAEAGAV